MTGSEKQEIFSLSDIFVCARCGYCCQGETTVSLDKEDQERMINKLGLTREEVREEVTRRDFRDTTRADSPLTLDATYEQVETGDLDVDGVVEEIVRRIGEISEQH